MPRSKSTRSLFLSPYAIRAIRSSKNLKCAVRHSSHDFATSEQGCQAVFRESCPGVAGLIQREINQRPCNRRETLADFHQCPGFNSLDQLNQNVIEDGDLWV